MSNVFISNIEAMIEALEWAKTDLYGYKWDEKSPFDAKLVELKKIREDALMTEKSPAPVGEPKAPSAPSEPVDALFLAWWQALCDLEPSVKYLSENAGMFSVELAVRERKLLASPAPSTDRAGEHDIRAAVATALMMALTWVDSHENFRGAFPTVENVLADPPTDKSANAEDSKGGART